MIILLTSGVLCAQTPLQVEPLQKTHKRAYLQHLSIYAEEYMKMSDGWDIHGNTTFPFACGLRYTFGFSHGSVLSDVAVGYHMRRNRQYYHTNNVELGLSSAYYFVGFLDSGYGGVSLGLYGLFNVSNEIDHSYKEVIGLYEECFNPYIVGIAIGLPKIMWKRLEMELNFKVGTPEFNATIMSNYTRDRVDVSVDYMLSVRVSYIIATNHE